MGRSELISLAYMIMKFINTGFRVVELLLILRVILSWIRLDPYHPIVNFIYRTTEPILEPIRQVLPTMSMIDFSPLVAFFLLSLLERVVTQILWRLLTLL